MSSGIETNYPAERSYSPSVEKDREAFEDVQEKVQTFGDHDV